MNEFVGLAVGGYWLYHQILDRRYYFEEDYLNR